MLRALNGLKNPKYTRLYVLHVEGYFGDADEYFCDDVDSVYDEKAVENAYRAYTHFKENWVEERDELPEEYREYIKGASWDHNVLPSGIDEISLYWYDDFGHPHDVEVT